MLNPAINYKVKIGGIYGDMTRIDILFEHVSTIEKSMKQITLLSGDENPAKHVNQMVRWVGNKEKHADEIQHIVTQYFMTQRVKPKDGDAKAKYLKQLTSLHGMLISAMKAKQTTDVANCAKLRGQIHAFSHAYFGAEDMKHIHEHHKGHK